MDKDETSKNPSEPFKPSATLPNRTVYLSLEEVGPYMKEHKLRLVSLVDKDGTILLPKQTAADPSSHRFIPASGTKGRCRAAARD